MLWHKRIIVYSNISLHGHGTNIFVTQNIFPCSEFNPTNYDYTKGFSLSLKQKNYIFRGFDQLRIQNLPLPYQFHHHH